MRAFPQPNLPVSALPAQVYRLFDADDSGELSWREVQMGFRKLGQRLGKTFSATVAHAGGEKY